MEIRDVTLAVRDDIDGSGLALRGWLKSAGPDVPWRVQPPEPSDGQGTLETINVVLESTTALLALYDRVRLWMENRGKRPKTVEGTTIIINGDSSHKVTVIIEPVAGGGDGQGAS